MPQPDLRPLDTAALNTFVTISESDSLTDAANRLGVSQSAISQSLKQLEAHTGVTLVVRRTSPLQLTPAGEVLRKHAASILGDLRRLNTTVREAAQQGVVQCRVGLITSCSEVFGSKLITVLKEKAERLSLKSGLTPQLIEAFLNREIDILISDDPLTGEEGLDRMKVFRDPMVLAYSPRLLPESEASLERLADHSPMIKYSRSTNIGIYSEVVLRRMHIQANIRYETDDSHTLMNFVRDGHGWAVLSALCLAQTFYNLDRIKVLELDKSKHSRNIYLIARKGELGSIPAQINEALQALFFENICPQLIGNYNWMTPGIFSPED
jgi:DNA-binding transcriptional LysR family regulator